MNRADSKKVRSVLPPRAAGVMMILVVLGLGACAGAGTPAATEASGALVSPQATGPAPSTTIPVTPTNTAPALPTPQPTSTTVPTVEVSAAVDQTAQATVAPRTEFDGIRALKDVGYQVSLGPRTPGSTAHAQTVDWIAAELAETGWETEIQETTANGRPIRNVIGKWGEGRPWILLGAHYDSRLEADRDPDPAKQKTPVPGANDGASGVAVLLELGRVLPERFRSGAAGAPWPGQIWLVFFDAEDNGRIEGWSWIMGSQAFVDELTDKPDAAVIVDMIGDADLNVYYELNSDRKLTEEIFSQAGELGYAAQFIPQEKHTIFDDHIPFREAGIPAVDLIDFDYPYWHTTADTTDKVSAGSLQAVGDTLLSWLTQDR